MSANHAIGVGTTVGWWWFTKDNFNTALLDIEQHLWQLTMLLVDNIPQKTIRLRVTVELLLDSP